MAVVRSCENLPALTDAVLGPACSLCENVMTNLDDCLITVCKHTFHKECILKWITTSHECPNCKKLCHAKDLAPANKGAIVKTISTSYRGRGRGSAIKRYNTRSGRVEVDMNNSQTTHSDNLENANNTGNLLDLNISIGEPNTSQNRSQNVQDNTKNTTSSSNRGKRQSQYMNRMSQMIESTVQRVLTNLQLSPERPVHNTVPQQVPLVNRSQNNNPPIIPSSEPEASPRSSNEVYSLNNLRMHPDKISNIIQSWHVKYDGSAKGLRCEEFLYRINCLTVENFNGNYDYICNNLHILLTGKAKDWYWRYHKSVTKIEWEPFCAALKYQYKDFRTSFDIREELHNRKQKPSETFESFYDAISEIIDNLSEPLEEEEIIEIVTRNLRPEIRHELLYVQIRSIAHLKKLCQKREKLLSEDAFKRGNFKTNVSFPSQQRRVAVVQTDTKMEDRLSNSEIDPIEQSVSHINAIVKTNKPIRCWNCDEEGHFWDMCLKERHIFCYGCGLKNVYKPQCENCSKNSKNYNGGDRSNQR